MKRYLLFLYYEESGGGLQDFKQDFDTLKEALDFCINFCFLGTKEVLDIKTGDSYLFCYDTLRFRHQGIIERKNNEA